MSDLYEARNSIYCYPNTDVLVNFFDIKDNDTLEKVERKIVLAKLYILRQNNNIGNFDVIHFTEIHKFLFEDIYPFAGKFRTENIAKGNFSFAEWQYVEEQLSELLDKLKKEKYLKGYNLEMLSKRLAYYMAELNVLHPFREGNGRTIREFIRELAYINGYLLDLREVEAEDILEASKKSITDTYNLEMILFKCLKEK